LIEEAHRGKQGVLAVGLQGGKVKITDLEDLPRLVEKDAQRPKDQWWLEIRPIAKIMSREPGAPD
jgi:6-phosphofructokinase 1